MLPNAYQMILAVELMSSDLNDPLTGPPPPPGAQGQAPALLE